MSTISKDDDDDDDFLRQLAEEYADQLAESLTGVENHLVNLGTSGVVPLELVRIVHSMKGAGASVGIPVISAICHQFEDQLANLSAAIPPTHETMDQFFRYVDLLRNARGVVLNKALNADMRAAELAMLGQRLNKISDKGLTRILLADSTRALSSMVEKTFQGMPVSILVVNDGLEAINRALTEPFDMVVVSGNLKQLDGCGVIAALKFSGNVHIPYCVLLTSQVNDKRYAACGADQVLPKTPEGLSSLRNGFEVRTSKAS